jgi:hypothetical protein
VRKCDKTKNLERFPIPSKWKTLELVPKNPTLGLDPRVETRLPAFAKPASAGEARSETIMLERFD